MSLPAPFVFTGQALRSLAAASAALVQPYDVVGSVTRILFDCAEAAGAVSAGLVVRVDPRHVELLAATSHRAEEIELYQVGDGGPCVETAETGEPCWVETLAEIESRWPRLATLFAEAGYHSVGATPLHWQGESVGALNLFFAQEGQQPSELADLAQAFADIATLAIVHAESVRTVRVLDNIRAALNERTLIEHAKGVLADRQHLPMDAAFAALLARADGRLLSETATEIIDAVIAGHDIRPDGR